MRFVLMTDRTVNQCMKALHERMQIKGTKARPTLDGWIEKNGQFMISVTSPVFGKFTRTTRLHATAAREDGTTVIRGYVPNGVPKNRLIAVGIGLGLLALYMFAQGNLMAALLVLLLGGAMLIPLWGDYRNHDVLLYELEKTLKAAPPDPKKPAPAKPAAKPSTVRKATPAPKPKAASGAARK